MRPFAFLVIGAACALATACGGAGAAPAPADSTAPPAGMPSWAEYRHLDGVLDMAGPLRDGAYVVSAGGRLFLFRPATGDLTAFGRGPGGYRSASNEPYLTVAADAAGAGCSFSRDQIFALEPSGKNPAVLVVDQAGHSRRFVSMPAGQFLSGIAFDVTGQFGHRLLVTSSRNGTSTVWAIDCGGHPAVMASIPAPVEGGLAVAPAVFGEFGGDLIAADENNGLVYAVTATGHVSVLAASGIPHGGDIGVESPGFVPLGFAAAYLADRYSGPKNKHPGDNYLLRLSAADLTRAGVRPGDLLVAAEGGALTIDIRCATSCSVRSIAGGPPIAHGEGHLIVVTG